MKELILRNYETQELMDKNINFKDVLENLKEIKTAHEKMLMKSIKVLLAPVVCSYDIKTLDFKLGHDGVSETIKVYIDNIDCHENKSKINSMDGTKKITYEKLQNNIYKVLGHVFFTLLDHEAFFNVVFLRKEYFHSELNQNLENKSTSLARKKL